LRHHLYKWHWHSVCKSVEFRCTSSKISFDTLLTHIKYFKFIDIRNFYYFPVSSADMNILYNLNIYKFISGVKFNLLLIGLLRQECCSIMTSWISLFSYGIICCFHNNLLWWKIIT
jgi:hypothetical protein